MAYQLIGGTLIDCAGNEPIDEAVLTFEGKFITHVGKMGEFDNTGNEKGNSIDFKGKTAMPGLINMHDHLVFKYAYGSPTTHLEKNPTALTVFALRTALETFRSGITTIRDMASLHQISLHLRDAINAGEIVGPRIISCNQPLCMTGGHAHELCIEVDGPDYLRKAARNQLKLGADFVKVMASHDPYHMPGVEQTRAELTLEEIRAAFEEAHKWGKFTACHAMGTGALSNCIEAGVDVVEHGGYLDQNLAKLMAQRDICYTPTLSAYTRQTMSPRFNRGAKWAEDHKVLVQPIKEAFQVALKEGVKVVCGTDSTGRYAEEVELMRKGGMGEMASLQACTKVAAEALGMGDILGTIEVGKLADIVIIDGNPLKDPYALERVELVIKEGIVYSPEDIRF